MAIVPFDKVQQIVKNNPNKAMIVQARDYSHKLKLNILGKDLGNSFVQSVYFENADVYAARTQGATSNKDLFSRLLHREEMVFTAKGGASFYTGLSPEQTIALDAHLDKIRFGMTIRKWVKEFALKAYRVDPMGVIYIEVDDLGNSYPTYKSTDCIFDYSANGRDLDYICFRLKAWEAKQFLPNDSSPDLNSTSNDWSQYYRFIDDEEDRIVKNISGIITLQDSIPLSFDELPGFRVSDIIDFSNPTSLLSPVHETLELATSYQVDRSIRDLSKKYSGFPKAYEPLLTCGLCLGIGLINAKPCPECTPPGETQRGTGFKLRTRVADVARFPLPKEGQSGGINDPSKFFGYITPHIDTWNKQDTSLNDIEAAMNDTYWGTTDKQSTTGPAVGAKGAFQETATKTLSDLQPIYARLNKTADWAQSTENEICDFIGEQMFPDSFKESVRTYGRYYILETPDELIVEYLDMKTKGAPQTALFDALEKYYHAVFSNDPMQLAIKVKLMKVEPFVHQSVTQVQASAPSKIDLYCKLYFSEWLAGVDNNYLLRTPIEKMIVDLQVYANAKMVLEPFNVVEPVASISETVRNTN